MVSASQLRFYHLTLHALVKPIHSLLDLIFLDANFSACLTVPKENFFIIQSEDFFKDPSVYYNKTLEFLNLSKYELDKYGTHMEGRYNDTQIESKTREKLESFFKPHNDELNSFLKRDFHW